MAKKASEVTSLRNLTIAGMGAKPKACINNGNKPVYMGRIFGVVNDIKYKEDKNNKLQAQFVGSFQGVNADGEVFESERLYLPGTIAEGVEGQHKSAGGAPVQFGFDIVAMESDKSPVGYAYSVKALIKTEASDKLAEMANAMAEIPLPAAATKK